MRNTTLKLPKKQSQAKASTFQSKSRNKEPIAEKNNNVRTPIVRSTNTRTRADFCFIPFSAAYKTRTPSPPIDVGKNILNIDPIK